MAWRTRRPRSAQRRAEAPLTRARIRCLPCSGVCHRQLPRRQPHAHARVEPGHAARGCAPDRERDGRHADHGSRRHRAAAQRHPAHELHRDTDAGWRRHAHHGDVSHAHRGLLRPRPQHHVHRHGHRHPARWHSGARDRRTHHLHARQLQRPRPHDGHAHGPHHRRRHHRPAQHPRAAHQLHGDAGARWRRHAHHCDVRQPQGLPRHRPLPRHHLFRDCGGQPARRRHHARLRRRLPDHAHRRRKRHARGAHHHRHQRHQPLLGHRVHRAAGHRAPAHQLHGDADAGRRRQPHHRHLLHAQQLPRDGPGSGDHLPGALPMRWGEACHGVSIPKGTVLPAPNSWCPNAGTTSPHRSPPPATCPTAAARPRPSRAW